MLSFKQFVTESTGKKLLHLEHIEDEVLNSGKLGIDSIINFLSSLTEMLSGSHNSNTVITTKWDGSPAIAAGEDPKTGNFFVSYKSMKKLNFNQDDIDVNFAGKDELKKIYYSLLENLKKINIKGTVLQGDVLWSDPSQIKRENIDGKTYVTFTPNTITYAIPFDTELAKTVLNSKVGIVFHTSFPTKNAESVDQLSANLGADVSFLKKHKDVFVTDSEFKDVSAKATFTKSDTNTVNGMINDIKTSADSLDSNFINDLSSNKKLVDDIKAFVNTLVRKGEFIDGSKTNQDRLVEYLKTKYSNDVAKLKTEKGRANKQQKYDELLDIVSSNINEIKNIFELMSKVNNVKVYIIRKLEQVKSLTNTFIKTDTGFKVTKPEGFVAIDTNNRTTGIKLVDRMEFSKNNFNASKNWDK